jgi:hypothetical protein
MLPSHNSGSSLLNQETTITGPRVEGTYIHHQANQQKNMKGKTQRNTNMFFDLLQSKAQKKKKQKLLCNPTLKHRQVYSNYNIQATNKYIANRCTR